MTEEDTAEIAKIRAQTARALRRGAWFYIVAIATVILAAGTSILITVKLTERSERKLCAVVINADEGYRSAPPTQPAGKQQARNIHRLRSQLGCPPYKGDQ